MRVTRPRATPPKHANTPHSRPHNGEPHVARPTLRPKTREHPAQRAPQRTLKVRRRPGTFRGEGSRAAVVNDTQTPERHPTRPRTPTSGRRQQTCASPANMGVTRPPLRHPNTRIPRTAGPTTGNLTLRGPLCAPKHANTPHSGPHNGEPHVARPTLRPKTREYPAKQAPQRGTSRCEARSAPQNTRIPRTAGPTTNA